MKFNSSNAKYYAKRSAAKRAPAKYDYQKEHAKEMRRQERNLKEFEKADEGFFNTDDLAVDYNYLNNLRKNAIRIEKAYFDKDSLRTYVDLKNYPKFRVNDATRNVYIMTDRVDEIRSNDKKTLKYLINNVIYVNDDIVVEEVELFIF